MSTSSTAFYVGMPHAPLQSVHDHAHNRDVWDIIEARVAEYEAFDPEVTILFGCDHYSNIFLDLAPTFLVGHIAESSGIDYGSVPGTLDVPMELSTDLAKYLVRNSFDIANSYKMALDHGFTVVLSHFLKGRLGARPVIPIHVNAMTDPLPTMKRCREFGAAVGQWALTLGKRVAFLGSGGLSHQTKDIFPQYDSARDEVIRTLIVNGPGEDSITEEKWHGDIGVAMAKASEKLIARQFDSGWLNQEWDLHFLETLRDGDLTAFDSWTDEYIRENAGYGAGEIRLILTAAAAAQQIGVKQFELDYYSNRTTFGTGYGIVHGLQPVTELATVR